MVRLKVLILIFALIRFSCFNSNMVRLKAELLEHKGVVQYVFQFQYGAIKSLGLGLYVASQSKFQFQYGAIKS